jgi:hypothetical protein
MTLPPATQRRWYVRQEHARDARLGDTAIRSFMWAAFPYKGRDTDGNPVRVGRSTFFASRAAAIRHARRQAHHDQGGRR